ncbi:substrate-binding domain-containing protein [Variovorax sp.]|nr:MAG: alkaline phosphatase [Variovorax sp.]
MISVNFKRNALSALVAVGVMTMAAAASAAVVGGGATLPEELYGKAKFPTSSTGILNKTPAPGFNTYVGIGSGGGKNSFFQNNSNLLVWDHDGNPATANVPFYSTPVTVDYAGSDSLVTAAEQTAYDNHTTLGKTSFGRLIQVPTVLTSVTVPYNISGRTSVNLTSAQLAQIFADPTITNWNQVTGFSTLNQPIKVIYRAESSGTSEIFLRHLNSVNSTLVPSVNSTFSSVVNVSNTSKYVAATGSDGVVAALAANPYSITYVSPDKLGAPLGTLTPAQLAAKVVAITRTISGTTSNLLPTEVNVTAAMTGINPPALASAPAVDWGIGAGSTAAALANPSQGYPIVGATNLIFSQCYADVSSGGDRDKVRQFLAQHYAPTSTVNDADIAAHSFIKLPSNWRTAIYNAFFTSTSPESVGYTSICTGKGRPL